MVTCLTLVRRVLNVLSDRIRLFPTCYVGYLQGFLYTLRLAVETPTSDLPNSLMNRSSSVLIALRDTHSWLVSCTQLIS